MLTKMIAVIVLAGFLARVPATEQSAKVSARTVGAVQMEKETDAVPGRVNLQGYLTDDQGEPVTGEHSMSFRIHRDGGVQWQEAQVCTVNAGLFSVPMGSVTPIPASVFEPGTACELELVVDDQVLSPRVEMTSTGFAFQAASVDRPLSPGMTSQEIGSGAVTMEKINQAGALSGYVLKWTGSGWAPRPDSVGGPPTGNAGGDLDGSYPNPTVVGLRGRDISSSSPSTNDILVYEYSRWNPMEIDGDVTGDVDDLEVVGLRGREIRSTTPYTNDMLVYKYSRWELEEPDGDVDGPIDDLTVVGLQGRAVSTNSPSSGDVLTWYSSRWTPRSPSLTAGPGRWHETFGGLRLTDGQASVELAPDFLVTVEVGSMRVFLTQTSGEPVPVVVHKNSFGFEVAGPASADVEFDYHVVAPRPGGER